MRNVQSKLRISLVLTAVAATAVAVTAPGQPSDTSQSSNSVVLGVSVGLLAVLLIVDIMFYKLAIATRRAQRTDQRIASWRITDAGWDAFVAFDKGRAAEMSGHLHAHVPRQKPPKGGVEVLAAKGGVLMDGVFLPIEPRGLGAARHIQWLTSLPECIEVTVIVPRANASGTLGSQPGLFRIPVSPAQREDAAAAFVYYKGQQESGELSEQGGLRLLVRISTALAVIGLPLGALGIWLNANQRMPGSDLPFLLAILGILGGIGGALVGLIVWAVMLRKRR